MTSNQLQAQKNMIDQQIADEQERHNKAVEDETARSDLANENLKEESNAIQQQIADESARHNKAMEDIQSEYNRVYLELQRAQGDRKLELEAQLREIQKQEADEVTRHNKTNEELADRSQQLNESIAAETERHNSVLEEIQGTANDLKSRSLDIQERLNYMQNTYWQGLLAAEESRIWIESRKTDNQYLLGLMQNNTARGNLLLSQDMWSTNKKKVTSEIIGNYFNTFTPNLKDITGAAGTLKLLVP